MSLVATSLLNMLIMYRHTLQAAYLVEPSGIEPLTSTLPVLRSPS